MLNVQKLEALNVYQIVVSCTTDSEGEFVLFDRSEKLSRDKVNPFVKFTIDLYARVLSAKIHIGILEGYLCRYKENYGTKERPFNIENMASLYENEPVYDFTFSILDDKTGKLTPQWSTRRFWCRENHFIALISDMDVNSKYREAGVDAYIINNLHEVLKVESGVIVDSVFLPEVLLAKNAKLALREAGFTRQDDEQNAYYARHSPLVVDDIPKKVGRSKGKVESKNVIAPATLVGVAVS